MTQTPNFRTLPADITMAFYDKDKARITPWFPANEPYLAGESDHGVTVHYVALSDGWDYFEGFYPACITMIRDTPCVIKFENENRAIERHWREIFNSS